MSTTKLGNDFRSYVLELLRTKYKDATTETKVSWKNADIVFTMMDFGKRVKVAVECKFYDRKLTTADFSSICRDYEAAFATQDIATLIIISKHDVEAASKQFLADTPRLRFLTASQLEEWLIGLRPYIETLAGVFQADAVSQYYIDSRVKDAALPAFDVLQSWLRTEGQDGLAILGGYGLGKSSLAKRLAADQAQKYLNDPAHERMPILIRLGQVVHETELSGLFGKEFTAEHVIEGYSFSTLMHLNNAGRLLVILDGFDEMKHAMTEVDFKSNFREFNKLRIGKAKVLLLGRPNAFTSESAALLIKGLSELGGQAYIDSDFPPWQELNLEFFSSDEVREFLVKYLNFAEIQKGVTANRSVIDQRVAEIIADVHPDILQRPVQARIVGQLAANPTYNFKNINRFRLYNDFVERMLGRDQEKRARSVIPQGSRRLFLEELAWWAWTRPDTAQGVFRKEEVPQSIFDALPNGQAINNNAKRSEYLVSSLTEHKDSDILYFAHRSFQEFLVASSISKRDAVDNLVLPLIGKAISQDVYSFLKEVDNFGYLHVIFNALNPRLQQGVNVRLLTLMQASSVVLSDIMSRNPRQYDVYDIVIGGLSSDNQKIDFETRIAWLTDAIYLSPMPAAECAFYILLVEAKKRLELLPTVFAKGLERVILGVDDANLSSHAIVVEDQHFGGIGLVLRDACKKVRSVREKRLRIVVDDAVDLLNKKIAGYGLHLRLEEPLASETATIFDFELIESNLRPEAKKTFRKMYSTKSDSFNLVAKIAKPIRKGAESNF